MGIYIILILMMIIIPEVTDPEEYILYSFRLYIEIARLFFYLLIILGKKKWQSSKLQASSQSKNNLNENLF